MLWAGKPRVHIPAGQDILIFAIMSRSALGPHTATIQWVLEVLSPG